MRSFSIQTLHYIAEAATASTVNLPVAARKPSQKRNILIDPSVMGDGAMGEFSQTVGEVITKGPLGAMGLAGDVLGIGGGKALLGFSVGPMGLGGKLAANAKKKFEREIEAQQEATRGMSNVSNFYKNLGISTRPLHEPGDIGEIGLIFKKYTEGLGGGLPGTLKSP